MRHLALEFLLTSTTFEWFRSRQFCFLESVLYKITSHAASPLYLTIAAVITGSEPCIRFLIKSFLRGTPRDYRVSDSYYAALVLKVRSQVWRQVFAPVWCGLSITMAHIERCDRNRYGPHLLLKNPFKGDSLP